MLGHKNIATTQIYAKILNEKVGKDMQKYHTNLRRWKALLFRNSKQIFRTNQEKSKQNTLAFFVILAFKLEKVFWQLHQVDQILFIAGVWACYKQVACNPFNQFNSP
jgi:hypothetical protein